LARKLCSLIMSWLMAMALRARQPGSALDDLPVRLARAGRRRPPGGGHGVAAAFDPVDTSELVAGFDGSDSVDTPLAVAGFYGGPTPTCRGALMVIEAALVVSRRMPVAASIFRIRSASRVADIRVGAA
jgi:hypothetical protein